MDSRNWRKLTLPELAMCKEHERQAIEDDLTVKNLIRSNLLLDREYNRLYLDILEKSESLLRIIQLTEGQLFSEYSNLSGQLKRLERAASISVDKFFRLFTATLVRSALTDKIISRDKLERILGSREKVDEIISRVKKGMYTNARKKLIMLSDRIQKGLNVFEEKRKIELYNILSSTTIHSCKKCAKVASLDRFKRCTCVCGEKISKPSQVKQISLKHFNDKLINFLKQNYWFEYGVDYLLRRKNLRTFVGYYVLGHSGVWHEIDNIAVSKSQKCRFFCECKNAEIKQNDILVFSGKMFDIGCTRGYVFTTAEQVSDEALRLARARNIDIIKGVLKREVTDLLKDIKEA